MNFDFDKERNVRINFLKRNVWILCVSVKRRKLNVLTFVKLTVKCMNINMC
jgi:hypothetical protein